MANEDRAVTKDNKFKGAGGHYFTKALFYDTAYANPVHCMYTLSDDESKGYPSLRRLYVESNDPSGYTLAITHLGGWEHWKKLCECDWFQTHLDAWREELETKLRAEALHRLMKEAANPDSKAYLEMNKLLLQKGWMAPEDRAAMIIDAQVKAGGKKGKGRPSDEKIKQEAIRLLQVDTSVDADLERIRAN